MSDIEHIMLAQKRRLGVMWAIDGVCAVIAVAALYGAMRMGLEALWAVVFGAAAVGFGAQIWFIVGLGRAKKGV